MGISAGNPDRLTYADRDESPLSQDRPDIDERIRMVWNMIDPRVFVP